MNLSESLLTAIGSIGANKLRAALTMLGVIIGVGAVIALMALGNGVISTDRENSGGHPVLTLSDVHALSNPLSAPALSGASAIVQGVQEVVYGGDSIDTTVAGVTANYLEMNNMGEFQVGDGITQGDLDNKERVAVLGSDAALELFGDDYALGKMVKINGVSYEVVGILDAQGSGLAGATDENIYVPLTTAQTRLYPARTRSGERAVSSIIAQTVSADESVAGEAQIKAVLREKHGLAADDEDDFGLFSMTSLLDMVSTITGTLTAFLGAIAGISLLVGGIGIMNIMLVSVTERTREIGIRKAIGALKRDILTQFLLESVLLSVLGGVIGILLGWALATVGGNALGLESVVDSGTVLLATGFAGGVGLVFGIYPAWRAASLQPIEALRYE